jgi:hypothetical protein
MSGTRTFDLKSIKKLQLSQSVIIQKIRVICVPLLPRQQIMTHHNNHDNQRSIPKSFSFPKPVPIRPILVIRVPLHPTLQRPLSTTHYSRVASQRQQPAAKSFPTKKSHPLSEMAPLIIYPALSEIGYPKKHSAYYSPTPS